MDSQERWLSVEEISTHLGITKITVYRWLEAEKIPAHRVGKQWRFKVSEIDQWVRSGSANNVSFEKELDQQHGI